MRTAGPRLLLLLPVFAAIAVAEAAQPTSLPSPGYLDDGVFREALRQRGLRDWVRQYDADTLADGIEGELRRREKLLDQAAEEATGPADRRRLVLEAHEILRTLLAANPSHPARLRWQLELARDRLDRQCPSAFDAVLLHELGGRDAAMVVDLAGDAVRILDLMRAEIADHWKSLESLDETSIDRLTTSGSLLPLQFMDAQSAMLLGWAHLYEALSAGDRSKRRKLMTQLLADATDRYNWVQPAPSNEVQRCSGLLIAAIAARCTDRPDEADRYAREIVAALQKVRSPLERKRLRKIALLGVLEQIRGLRDAGKLTEALQAIDQARAWAAKSRADDPGVLLSLAFAEAMVRGSQARTATAPPGDFEPFGPTATIEPLIAFVAGPPLHRDLAYSALAGFCDSPPERVDPPRLQLWAGGAVADSCFAAESQPAGESPAGLAVKALQGTLNGGKQTLSDPLRGELMFLLGRAQSRLGTTADAIATFCTLAESIPAHDRAPEVAKQATVLAEEGLRRPDGEQSQSVRRAFIRAAGLLRRIAGSAAGPHLQYAIALTMEKDGQFLAAADEYAAVPTGSPDSDAAVLGRARCLHAAFGQAAAEPKPAAELKAMVDRAIEAARAAIRIRTTTRPVDQPDCVQAEMTLLLAGLMNHPAASMASETISVLDDFESRFATCPGIVGPALRERILALRKLNRMGEARRVVEQYLAMDPQAAGPVMATLLEAMRTETEAALERGEADAAHEIAREAAQLARQLLEWVHAPGHDVDAAQCLAIRVWRAWALLQSGRPQEAADVYGECVRMQDALSADAALRIEIRLGSAEAQLALGRAREVQPVFNDIWLRVPERSPYWWRALVGSLRCHTELGGDARRILQTIRQQRNLAPDMGGPRWKRAMEELERANLARAASQPTSAGS